MKGINILIAAAVLAATCGCHILDNNFFPADSRAETQRGSGNATKDSSAIPPVIFPVSKADTEIMCTAVRFPPGFNWRQDPTYKGSYCEILLYRNGKIEKRIEAGSGRNISYDADMHHLIGHDIYTEYSSTTETVICINGDEILRFEGLELLKGLVFQDGDLHTLSVGKNGYGLTYRKNGEAVLKKDHKVKVFGSLEDPNFPETGALYEDDMSRIVFCYGDMKTNRTYHIVKDGADEVFDYSGPALLDMKIIADSVHYVPSEAFGADWEEAYIPYHNPNIVTGCIEGNATIYDKVKQEIISLCGRDAVIYCNDGIAAALYHPSQGKCSVYYSNGQCRFFQEKCTLYTRRCATLVGETMAIAMSPTDNGQEPYLVLGEKKIFLEGLENGFVSGIRITVSQPN